MTKAKIFKAPEPFPQDGVINVFLGGSIEMGVAEKWQERVTEELSGFQINILNPRRDDWDSSWKQDPTPGTQFHEQVSWELEAQDCSNILLYYFAGNTMSPITLLELGMFGIDLIEDNYTGYGPDVFVYIDKDYLRYGNVVMVCDKFGINWTSDKEEFYRRIKNRVQKYEKILWGEV